MTPSEKKCSKSFVGGLVNVINWSRVIKALGNKQIHKYTKDGCKGFYLCSPLQPSFVYFFGPKTIIVGEYINTHYKMT
jgi:hypothetical protein